MPEHTEEIDQIGPYYKKRFEELSDSPESDVKGSLFEKMDMLEGKRPKTVYLHFNVFGMKVAASITVLVVSSLALMAVAAVTILAIRNNRLQRDKNIKVFPQEQKVVLQELDIKKRPSSIDPLKNKKRENEWEETNKAAPSEGLKDSAEFIPVAPIEQQKEKAKNRTPIPIKRNGDNSQLLKELEEEELFKKKD